eukprot:866320-Prorocentrum_minimum.AAC.6
MVMHVVSISKLSTACVWKVVALATLLHGFHVQWLVWGALHLATLSVEIWLLKYECYVGKHNDGVRTMSHLCPARTTLFAPLFLEQGAYLLIVVTITYVLPTHHQGRGLNRIVIMMTQLLGGVLGTYAANQTATLYAMAALALHGKRNRQNTLMRNFNATYAMWSFTVGAHLHFVWITFVFAYFNALAIESGPAPPTIRRQNHDHQE